LRDLSRELYKSLADNAVQLGSRAKINSAKAMNLRDKIEENARTSNVGKCVAVDAVFSERSLVRIPC
jgi:hypothetical protein